MRYYNYQQPPTKFARGTDLFSQQPPSTVAGDYAIEATAPSLSTGGMRNFGSLVPEDGNAYRAFVLPDDGGHAPGFSGLLHEKYYNSGVRNWSNQLRDDDGGHASGFSGLLHETYYNYGVRNWSNQLPEGNAHRALVPTVVDSGLAPGLSGVLHEKYNSGVRNWSNQVRDGSVYHQQPTVAGDYETAPTLSTGGMRNFGSLYPADGNAYHAFDPTVGGGHAPGISGLLHRGT